MTTFALFHGCSHGGWCWERTAPRLEERGHRTVTPDLPMHDPGKGARDWAEVVARCPARRVAATRLGGDLRELSGSHSPF